MNGQGSHARGGGSVKAQSGLRQRCSGWGSKHLTGVQALAAALAVQSCRAQLWQWR